MMTPEEVSVRVESMLEEINSAGFDEEESHKKEDALYKEVLRAIAAGDCEDPKCCALAALKLSSSDHTRWYA